MSLALKEILYDAMREPVGIVVATNDASFLRQKLYALRKDDPDLAALSFVISPTNGLDLWILNNAK